VSSGNEKPAWVPDIKRSKKATINPLEHAPPENCEKGAILIRTLHPSAYPNPYWVYYSLLKPLSNQQVAELVNLDVRLGFHVDAKPGKDHTRFEFPDKWPYCNGFEFKSIESYVPLITALNFSTPGGYATVCEESFRLLTRVTSLTASRNHFEQQAVATIGALTSLKILQLDLCGLRNSEFERGFFQPLSGRLTTLKMPDNFLTYLPDDFYELRALTDLNLEGNQLVRIDSRISQLKSLTALDLSGNELTCLPESIGELGGTLRTLNLRGNKLVTLPDAMGHISRLSNLNLSANEYLIALPDSMGKLTQVCALCSLLASVFSSYLNTSLLSFSFSSDSFFFFWNIITFCFLVSFSFQ
jgi:hypothetical protein